jgi:hypothetical protein
MASHVKLKKEAEKSATILRSRLLNEVADLDDSASNTVDKYIDFMIENELKHLCEQASNKFDHEADSSDYLEDPQTIIAWWIFKTQKNPIDEPVKVQAKQEVMALAPDVRPSKIREITKVAFRRAMAKRLDTDLNANLESD